jgi:hypothetical protein
VSSLAYRLGQFFGGLAAQVTPAERELAARVLPAQAFPLFAAMPADAQRHSLNVLHTLWAAGQRDPDLAAAALLHDAGKVAAAQGGVALGLWLRGPLVVGDKLAPGLLRRLAQNDPARGWRYALYVHLEHPAIGAAWAAAAGCSPLTCWLIACHQEPVTAATVPAGVTDPAATALLAALQRADGRN